MPLRHDADLVRRLLRAQGSARRAAAPEPKPTFAVEATARQRARSNAASERQRAKDALLAPSAKARLLPVASAREPGSVRRSVGREEGRGEVLMSETL